MPRKKVEKVETHANSSSTNISRSNKQLSETVDRTVNAQENRQSPVITTVGDIANLLESVFNQLVRNLVDLNHPYPHQAAKEMITAGYNVALISVETLSNEPVKLIGFNR